MALIGGDLSNGALALSLHFCRDATVAEHIEHIPGSAEDRGLLNLFPQIEHYIAFADSIGALIEDTWLKFLSFFSPENAKEAIL